MPQPIRLPIRGMPCTVGGWSFGVHLQFRTQFPKADDDIGIEDKWPELTGANSLEGAEVEHFGAKGGAQPRYFSARIDTRETPVGAVFTMKKHEGSHRVRTSSSNRVQQPSSDVSSQSSRFHNVILHMLSQHLVR